jgi:hypothetical protein
MTIQSLNEDSVASYLKQNNDFFERNSEILEELHLSHQTAGAISLIERQVALLRENNHKLKKQLKELVDIAKDNDRLSEAMHKLTLDVLKANSAAEILNTTAHHLKHQFDSEFVSIQLLAGLFSNVGESGAVVLIAKDSPESVANILKRGKPICGKLTGEQLNICFKDMAANTQSAAIIPLKKPHNGDTLGLIAIGSQNPKRFHITMGTIFLEHMGQIISHALARHA